MIFITLQQIIGNQATIIREYGGVPGIRDLGLLTSAIAMPQAEMFGQELHPTIFDKAAAYLFHILANHPFVDGNKRTGAAAALTFLSLNNHHISFSEEQSFLFEELVVAIAKGESTKKQISEFFAECAEKKQRQVEKEGVSE